ncbi:MAG: O-antigen ligase family protein [Pirellulaceae bacterium]
MSWIINLVPLVALFLWLSWRRRPAIALGSIIPLAFAFPVWIQWVLFDVPAGTIVGAGADLKVLVGTSALLLYCFLPGARFTVRLVACDLAVIALILVHCISDFRVDGISFHPLMRAYGEWYVPYLCGRLAIQTESDWRELWPIIASLSALLGIMAVIEAVSGTNLYELLYGLRPMENTPRDSIRWGLRRAYGPTLNPIYFGVLQLLLLGWSGFAAHQAVRREAAGYWLLAPVPGVLGIICTGSRGPILGCILMCAMAVFLWFPRLRLAFLAMGICLVLGVVVNRDRALNLLEAWSGETSHGANERVVEIDDELKTYSRTRTRLLMFDVYKIAFKRSGLFGFGTTAVTGFPVNVPLGPREAATMEKVPYIDNSYALITLRFGLLGMAAYAGACLLGVWHAARLADYYRGEEMAGLLIMIAAALTSALFVQATVWLAPDFAFPLMWTIGISSGFAVAHRYDEL